MSEILEFWCSGFYNFSSLRSSNDLQWVKEQTDVGPAAGGLTPTWWLLGCSGSSCSTQKRWWRTPARECSCSKSRPLIQTSEPTARSPTLSTVQMQTSSTWNSGQVKHWPFGVGLFWPSFSSGVFDEQVSFLVDQVRLWLFWRKISFISVCWRSINHFLHKQTSVRMLRVNLTQSLRLQRVMVSLEKEI